MRNAIFLSAVLTAAIPGTPSGTGGAPLDRLEWLAGCWEQRGPDRVAQEHWMAPLGGSMIGISRTVVGGATVAWELLRIEESEGKLSLVATPSGQQETRFRQVEVTGSGAAFENPEHDFPQRIEYWRQPDGSLLARISGDIDGKARSVDFPMLRVECPGAGGATSD